MASLLDTARDVLTPGVVHGIGNVIGESSTATRGALRYALPSVLAAVLAQASTPAGADHLHWTITEGGYGGGTLESVSRMLAGGGATERLVANGGRLLTGLFGENADSAVGSVANASGFSSRTTSTVLRLVAPIVMAVIGEQITRRRLDGKGLFDLLMGERAPILAAAPAALLKQLGLGGPSAVERDISTRVPTGRAVGDPVARFRMLRWWPVLATGLVGLVLMSMLGREPRRESASTDAPSASVNPSIDLTLPDGRRIVVDRDGGLNRLNAYLSDPASGTPPKHFVLENFAFEPGTPRLSGSSERMVNALIALLEAYPSARVQLEGHRAEAIKQMLMSGGVAADRVRVDASDTEAGRAQGWRIELIVLER